MDETYKNSQIFCCIVQHPCQIFFDISDHFSKVFFLSSLSAFPMIYTSSFERPIAFLLQELFLYSFFLLFTLAKQSLLTVLPTNHYFFFYSWLFSDLQTLINPFMPLDYVWGIDRSFILPWTPCFYPKRIGICNHTYIRQWFSNFVTIAFALRSDWTITNKIDSSLIDPLDGKSNKTNKIVYNGSSTVNVTFAAISYIQLITTFSTAAQNGAI